MNIDKVKTLLAWLVLALSASLLRYQVSLHSDTLFLDDLFSDLLQRGGRWSEWKFSSAPAFVPDMLLYLLAFPLFEQAASRIFFVSVSQVFLLALALLWCARKIHPALSRQASWSILLLLAFFTLTSAHSGMWLYFYSTNNHMASLMFGLTGIGLLLTYLTRPRAGVAALVVANSVAGTVSTELFVLSFTAPTLLLLSAAWLAMADPQRRSQTQRRTLRQLATLLVGAHVLAVLLSKLLVHNPATEGRISPSPQSAGNALRNFLQALKSAFAPDNLYTLCCALLVLLALAWLASRLLRTVSLQAHGLQLRVADLRYGAAAAMLLLGLPLNVAGIILSGGFGDPFALRYLTLPLALALLLAVITLDRLPAGRSRWSLGAQLTVSAVIVISAVRLLRDAPPPIMDASSLAADCLERIENQGFALRAGIADYWNARGVSDKLAHHNPILVTDNRLAPDFHVSTIGPVLRPQNYPRHDYNFALIYTDANPVNPNYTVSALRQVLPPPARVERCGNEKLEIWLYQDQRLDQAVKQAGATWLLHRQQKRSR